MEKTEYTSKDEIVFVVSDDGDKGIHFDESVKIIKKQIRPDEIDFGWGIDSAKGRFFKDQIEVFISYTNWFGTEIRVSAGLSSDQISKVRDWADLIREGLKDRV